jgi:hypothetical protein
MTKYLILFLAMCGSISFAVNEAGAASVPVFRYALERWKPDPYEGIFIYRRALSPQDQVLLQQLEKMTGNAENPLNLRFRPVEATAFGEEKLIELLKRPIPVKLPVLAIWYPEQMGKAAPFWMESVTSDGLKALVDSPMLKKLTESLIEGKSAIWIFVPSGNSSKDESTLKLLRWELNRASDNLAKTPTFFSTGSKRKKLAYNFPILTLSRSDTRERFFLNMLLHSESGLGKHADEPIVFPVFGRGRMFGVMIGEQIGEKNIQAIVSYLTAPCSRESKAQHPGMDLLLSAFWDKVATGELFVNDANSAPELTSVATETSKPVAAMEGKPDQPGRHFIVGRIYGIILGSVMVIVAFAVWILIRRRKKD